MPSIARELSTDGDAVATVVEALASAGWLAAVEAGEPSYILARDPASIELAKLDELASDDGALEAVRPEARRALLEESACGRAASQGRTLADVLDPTRPA